MQLSEKFVLDTTSYFQIIGERTQDDYSNELIHYWRNTKIYHFIQLIKIILILKVEYQMVKLVLYRRK